jgi:hypothetical protein
VEQKASDRDGRYKLRSHRWANKLGATLKELAAFGQPVTVHGPMESENAVRPSFYSLLQNWPFHWTDYMLRQAPVAALSAAFELSDEVPERKAPRHALRGYARHNQLMIDLREFAQPAVNEGPGVERSAPPDAIGGDLGPDALLATLWSAATGGGYVTWSPPPSRGIADPLPEIRRSPTPGYLKALHEIVTALPYRQMDPFNECVSPADQEIEGQLYRTNFCLAKPAEVYLIFSVLGGPLWVVPQPGQEYQVTRIDPRTGARVDLGSIDGQPHEIALPEGEQVLLLERDG